MARYHDEEWGVPVHDDRILFEFLILEGAQAGLSWETILRKRDHYREVFDGFDASQDRAYDARKVRALLADPGIVRNRLKISSTISNAQAFLDCSASSAASTPTSGTSRGGKRYGRAAAPKDVPARTAESDAMSKALKQRGFNFVGSTICYAFMQATGMVNDHLASLLPLAGSLTRASHGSFSVNSDFAQTGVGTRVRSAGFPPAN